MSRKILLYALVLSLCGAGSLQADLLGTSDYDQVRINDNTKEKPLYQVFNRYFGNEYYNQTGERFTDSNDLYDALKMNPTSGQITVGENATVQMYYKEAAFDHNVAIVDSMTGKTAAQFKFNDWTVGVPGNKVSLAAGEYDLMLKASSGSTSYDFSFDPSQNRDGLVHMIMLDLSWFYDEPAFMVAIEDMYNGSIYGNPDWDFNDGIYVFRSVEASIDIPPIVTPPGDGGTVPEPATALILGLGALGLPLARRFRKKNAK